MTERQHASPFTPDQERCLKEMVREAARLAVGASAGDTVRLLEVFDLMCIESDLAGRPLSNDDLVANHEDAIEQVNVQRKIGARFD